MPGAFIHGAKTVCKLNALDLSPYVKSSEISIEADEHDVTGGGAVGHGVQGGLLVSKVTLSGTYFSGTTGPRGIIKPLIGTNTPFIRQPEGTGTTLPQDSATVLVKSYVETSPVADMIAWSSELIVSGVVNAAPQP